MIRDCTKCGKPTVSPAGVCLKCTEPGEREPHWMTRDACIKMMRQQIETAEQEVMECAAAERDYCIGFKRALKHVYLLLTGERYKK